MAPDAVATLKRKGRSVLSNVLNVLPPENCSEVEDLIQELKVPGSAVRGIYSRFLQLRRRDQGLVSVSRRNEVKCSTCIHLVKSRHTWVQKILRCLLELGGFQDVISWEGFLFTMLQFCRMSKVELCQFMFYAVAMEMKTWSIYFVTSTQLEEFYAEYHACPITSFNTSHIDFGRLPMSRYRLYEFVELAFGFGELVNPCLHLQNELRKSIPSMAFWKNIHTFKATNGRVTLEHFRVHKSSSFAEALQMMSGKKLRELQDKSFKLGDIVEVPQLPTKQEPRPGFMPLPLGPTRPFGHRPAVRQEPPEWMQEHLKGNVDPHSLRDLGSAAEASMEPDVAPPLPEGWEAVTDPDRPKRLYYWNRTTNEVSWTPPRLPRTTMEEAQERMRATMGTCQQTMQPDGFLDGYVTQPNARDRKERVVEDERAQELLFVRRTREGVKRQPPASMLSTTMSSFRRFGSTR